MQESESLEPMGNARSFCGDPPGKYIGNMMHGGKTYYYYKKGLEYFYETDFDRKMREKEKERKRNRFVKKGGGE